MNNSTLETPACWLVELDRELRIIGIAESAPGGPRSPFEIELPLGIVLVEAIAVHNGRAADLSARMAGGQEVKSFRYALNTEFHGRHTYDLSSTPMFDADGAVTGHRCCVIDVTALLQMRERHDHSELTLEGAFNAYPNLLIVKDVEGRYIRVNEAARRIMSNWHADPIGRTSTECFPCDVAADFCREDNTVLRTEKAKDIEHEILLSDGLHTFLTTKFPIFDRDGCIVALGASAVDITERKRLESELDSMANFDKLTELPNRHHGKARLDEAVTWAQHVGGQVGLLIVDINHFKTINNTLGHAVGDQLLIEAAWRLRGCMDDGGTLMRLSGDEFGLVVGWNDRRDLSWIATTIIAAFDEPFMIEGHELFIGLNIGSAAYPDDADGPEQLIRCADLALIAAKKAGVPHSRFDKDIRAAVHRTSQIAGLLRKGLQRREFILHYQPLVDSRTREIIGAEALIRWNSHELGFVGPNQFIPVAEETGLVVPIGVWVLDQACRDAAEWNRAGAGPLSVAVNISPKQLLTPGFHQLVADTLEKTGLAPDLLKIEITESSLASDVETCGRIIDELRDMGVVLALDDFGTGYSALSYLQRFKFDILKLDQSFVRETERGTSGAALTASIIQMAKCLGMTTVGEGVETDDHVDLLQESGCDLMQGYLFSKPVRHEDFLALVAGFAAVAQAA